MAGIIGGSTGNDGGKYQELSMIASQSACTRWLPNLERSCYSPLPFRFFGISICDDGQRLSTDYGIFCPGGADSNSFDQQYVLNVVTVTDGWHNELYYYSPPPYQSYVLWSSGPNGRTYPPWMSREGLSESQNKCISAWIDDDIVNMSN